MKKVKKINTGITAFVGLSCLVSVIGALAV